MRIAVLGATGKTGRLLVSELGRRGHQLVILVRSSADLVDDVHVDRVVIGDSRHRGALDQLVSGADAVVSALGRVGRERNLLRDTAAELIPAMLEADVRRFLGISCARVAVPGDQRRRWSAAAAWTTRMVWPAIYADKAAELAAWTASDRVWTLVRPVRVLEGPATKHLEHDARRLPRSEMVARPDLVVFVAQLLRDEAYAGEAPFVASAPR